MIKITFYANDRLLEQSFVVLFTGHADYAPKGCDIVCAGVSALAMALSARLDACCDHYKVDTSDGRVLMKGEGKDALQAFLTITAGCEVMEQEYPDYIAITEVSHPEDVTDDQDSDLV